MGFEPYLFSEDMPGRWKALAEGLGFPYTPELWPGDCGRDGERSAEIEGVK